MMTVNIIGMGEIGTTIYDEIDKRLDNNGDVGIYATNIKLYGTEINPKRVRELGEKGYSVGIPILEKADIYIIAVYTTSQVIKALEQIYYISEDKDTPLVSIESTAQPNQLHEIETYNKDFYIILFPHRFNPNDPKHKVFNLDRVMGAFDEKSLKKGLQFYSKFMDRKLIHIFEPEIVALAKPLENAYRFAEIIIAQEIYLLCKEKDLDFDKLREAMRTKWNIDVKEAREGVGGKCLPKDIGIINKYLKYNSLFWSFLESRNKAYKLLKKEEQ